LCDRIFPTVGWECAVKFVPVDVGSWIQGAGDGKEALWTGQLVNLLRQIVVAVAEGI
jgi:hypothetical protein